MVVTEEYQGNSLSSRCLVSLPGDGVRVGLEVVARGRKGKLLKTCYIPCKISSPFVETMQADETLVLCCPESPAETPNKIGSRSTVSGLC